MRRIEDDIVDPIEGIIAEIPIPVRRHVVVESSTDEQTRIEARQTDPDEIRRLNSRRSAAAPAVTLGTGPVPVRIRARTEEKVGA